MPDEHRDLRAEGRVATVPSEITMISAERTKSVRIAPLILSFSTRDEVDRGIGQRAGAARRSARFVLLRRCRSLCASFSKPS